MAKAEQTIAFSFGKILSKTLRTELDKIAASKTSSTKAARIAAKVLATGEATKADYMTLAASVLAQKEVKPRASQAAK